MTKLFRVDVHFYRRVGSWSDSYIVYANSDDEALEKVKPVSAWDGSSSATISEIDPTSPVQIVEG